MEKFCAYMVLEIIAIDFNHVAAIFCMGKLELRTSVVMY